MRYKLSGRMTHKRINRWRLGDKMRHRKTGHGHILEMHRRYAGLSLREGADLLCLSVDTLALLEKTNILEPNFLGRMCNLYGQRPLLTPRMLKFARQNLHLDNYGLWNLGVSPAKWRAWEQGDKVPPYHWLLSMLKRDVFPHTQYYPKTIQVIGSWLQVDPEKIQDYKDRFKYHWVTDYHAIKEID